MFCSCFTAKCCLHIGADTSTERIILFTEKSIQTCRSKKELRDKEKKRKSKYDDVTLPDLIDQTTGYHASCFRNFTSVHLKKTDSSDSLMSVESENSTKDVELSEIEEDEPMKSELDPESI